MKKPVIIIIAVVAFVLTALTTAWVINFYITLFISGYNTSEVMVIDTNHDENNKEFKVIKTISKDGTNVLVILTKNTFGIWSITQKQEKIDDYTMTTIGWVNKGELKRYSFKEGGTIENEWNIVYCGNNAQKLIEFSPGQIPENTTVNIQQNASSYMIHIISFSSSAPLNNFNVPYLLTENGCISIK